MKITISIIFIVVLALMTLGLNGTGFAFHDGGVARCEGCHTMHNSINGIAMQTIGGMTQFSSGASLLQGPDASTACLNCHGTSGGEELVSTEAVGADPATIPNQFTPGGDFSWIKYVAGTVDGDNRGHNIVALGYDYIADKRLAVAPGGSFPREAFGCTGCHDPHGRTRRTITGYETPSIGTTTSLPISGSGSYGAEPTATAAVGAYRLLGGDGYIPVNGGGLEFNADPPLAVAPADYNREENTNMTRVVYGQGMSEWCANCHSGIHLTTAYSPGATGLKHPAGNSATLGAIADNYNAYVRSGNLSGTSTNSYNSLVPYEEQSTNVADMLTRAKIDNSALSGPSGSSTVSCLSCHRTHASGFASMFRYDVSDTLITDANGLFAPRDGMTISALTAAYYGRNAAYFGVSQRVLCNKCHVKD